MKTRLLTVLAATAGLATAQTTASYTLYGEGCNSQPIQSCLALNDVNPVLTVASLPNEYAYPVLNTTGQPIQVVGFEIFTVTNTATTQTVNSGIVYDLSGPTATVHTRPDPNLAAKGRITATGTQGWCSTAVYPPVVIPAGGAFWLQADAYSLVAPPQHAVGGASGPTSNWYRRPSNGMVWTVSVSVVRPIFRVHCVPAQPTVPALTATGLPQFSTTMQLAISGGAPLYPAFLVWALDNTQWLSMPTPVDLGMFGAPNCFNRTRTDNTQLVLLDAQGAGSVGFTVPGSTALGGLQFYNQGIVVVPGANALDLLVTNAAAGVIGN